MTTLARRGLLAWLGACAAIVTLAPPAVAQDGEESIGNVEISFDVGDFDATTDDFTIDAVEVSGDLLDGEEFTVVLTGAGGNVVWSTTDTFTAPVTRVPVTEAVGVGDVVEAGVEQAFLPEVEAVVIEPPEVDYKAGGGNGGGQLALSMVMTVLLVAIMFRTPLPSATAQRWTK
jgi:hypothetical protein